MKIILGSQSSNRREIFEIVGIDVEVIVSEVDEKGIRDKDLEVRALKIAKLKMEKIKEEYLKNNSEPAVIITADGFNESQGKVLEKPASLDEAKEMLRHLSGDKTIFYSALVMYNTNLDEEFSSVVSCSCWFRDLSEEEIDWYVKRTPVMKYAAAYSPLNTAAISFISRVEGSISGFSHSVPMDLVVPQLRKWGAV